MNKPSDRPNAPDYDELLSENRALKDALADLQSRNTLTWRLILETGRRLQVSSASIKAAVSSLLNYELFWDPANQHEFLKTIDNSVDRSSKLVLLLTLASRTEAGELVINREPQVFQEIIAILQADIMGRYPDLIEKINLPQDGAQVIVDYEYLILALKFIFEYLYSRAGIERLSVHILEESGFWNLEIDGLDAGTKKMIETMRFCKTDERLAPENLILPEYILGLHIACEILHLQEIGIAVIEKPDDVFSLHLTIPAYKDQR